MNFSESALVILDMTELLQDLRYAIRMLLKAKLFTGASVLTLGLGIGATTTIFSFVYGVLLKPLPYRDPDRIVLLFETSERARKVFGIGQIPVSPAMATEWKSRSKSFESMGVFRGVQSNIGGATRPERVRGAWISRGALDAVGATTVSGRLFTEAEQEAHGDQIVISENFWRTRLNGRTDVVGSTLRVDDKPLTIIGVLPAWFGFPRGYELAHDARTVEPPQFWRPLALSPSDRTNLGNHNTSAVGRLREGVSPAQANGELAAISSAVYKAVQPSAAAEFGVSVTPYHQNLVSQSRKSLVLLAASVLMVLLIACINLAGLLMVQSVGRAREMAIRASLGAGPVRLVGQVLTESLLLATAGGAAGVLVATWGVQILRGLAGSRMARVEEVAVDWTVLGFSLLLSLVTALAFGVAPALAAIRVNLAGTLKESGRTVSGTGNYRMRSALVVAQVALSMMLLAGAGLLIRSFIAVLQSDRGFQVSSVLTMRVPLPNYRYRNDAAKQAFFDRLLPEVQSLPRVESAGMVSQLPLAGQENIHSISVENRQARPGEEPVAEVRYVSPGYFDTIRLPLRSGRWLSPSDASTSLPAAVINETMARRFWPGENPIGKRFRQGQRASLPLVTVVGVAADSRQSSLEKEITPQVFRPYSQETSSDMCLTVRTSGDPRALAGAIREKIAAIDPEQPVLQVRTFQEVLEESVAGRKLQTYVLAAFAVYSLLLAAIGLHGVIAYSVSQRTREFGVRLALGAAQQQLLAMVVREGLKLAVLGLAAGLALALALSRLLAGFLYGVRTSDAVTLAVAAILMLACSFSATLMPALRASRVDPIHALREG